MVLLVGSLLVVMGVSYGAIRRLPITSSIVYLAVGVLVGPTVLNLFHFNPLKQSALLEVLIEGAVLISLNAVRVKMPVPWSFRRWRVKARVFKEHLERLSQVVLIILVGGSLFLNSLSWFT